MSTPNTKTDLRWIDRHKAGEWTGSQLVDRSTGEAVAECWPTYGRVGWEVHGYDGLVGFENERPAAKRAARKALLDEIRPTDTPTELALQTALDIATTFTYGADRVQMHVVDETTVLAVGFATNGTGRASGRVAWIMREDIGDPWVVERRYSDPPALSLDIADPSPDSMTDLDTDEDLKGLAAWLRGEA